MTGFFVRIKRNTRWINADFAELTSSEMEEFLEGKTREMNALEVHDYLSRLVVHFATWIRDNVKAVN